MWLPDDRVSGVPRAATVVARRRLRVEGALQTLVHAISIAAFTEGLSQAEVRRPLRPFWRPF